MSLLREPSQLVDGLVVSALTLVHGAMQCPSVTSMLYAEVLSVLLILILSPWFLTRYKIALF